MSLENINLFKKTLKYLLPEFIKKIIINTKNKFINYFYKFIFINKNYYFRDIFKFSRQEIIFLDSLEAIEILVKEEKSDIYSPRLNNIDQEKISVVAVAVKLYSLDNVIVNIRSSNFITNENVIIERIPSIELKYSNYATGAITLHDSENALCKKINVNPSNIDNGIFFGGNGSWNYYHWMTEILPKVQFIIKNNLLNFSKNIILSSEVKNIDSFKRTLEYAFQNVEINLIFLNQFEYYNVEKLYVISTPSNVLFNSKEIISSAKFNFYRKNSLDYVRDIVIGMMSKYEKEKLLTVVEKLKDKQGKINIFLARKSGSARGYNQEEIIDLLVSKFNIKVIYIEDYTIEEQAFIFSNVDLIIGASDAAWTNLIFCKKNTIALSWLPKHSKDFSAFSTIANYYSVKKYFIDCIPENKEELHSKYKVSLEQLKAQLKYLKFNIDLI